MVMVTHNIEEAVLLADRILILGTNPGRIRADLRNPLARPRRRRTPDFDALVDEIYRMMTHREATYTAPSPAEQRGPGSLNQTPLPQATVDGLRPVSPRSCSAATTAPPTWPTWRKGSACRWTTCCRWSTRWSCSASPT